MTEEHFPIVIFRAYGPGATKDRLDPILPYFDDLYGVKRCYRCSRCDEQRTVYIRYGDAPKQTGKDGDLVEIELSFQHTVCYDCFEKAIYPLLFKMKEPEDTLIYIAHASAILTICARKKECKREAKQ